MLWQGPGHGINTQLACGYLVEAVAHTKERTITSSAMQVMDKEIKCLGEVGTLAWIDC